MRLWPRPAQADLERLRASVMFDPCWYQAQHPDLALSAMDPARHFLSYGAWLGRDPGPSFNMPFYHDTHPGAVRRGLNALLDDLADPDAAVASADPGRALWAAAHEAQRSGDYARAEKLARPILGDARAYTLPVLGANQALARGDMAGWLQNFSLYLGHFDLPPLTLTAQEGPLLTRLGAASSGPQSGDALISVLMPVWNAETTVAAAAASILTQSWGNLELIIVDDSSSDGTWAALRQIAARDDRVRIMRNPENVGPYVSKNRALQAAQGAWITGQDGDDWSHPLRLENHMKAARAAQLQVSVGRMVRIQPDGQIGTMVQSDYCPDGVARRASISALFARDVLTHQLGYWDSVRAGADSEMLSRARLLLGDGFAELDQITMICLDLAGSLTNHAVVGARKGRAIENHPRSQYRDAWLAWHQSAPPLEALFMPFPQRDRPYPCPEAMEVGG
ncbi:MAG: glycosyltransferase family 2 protein [Sulfitobacter sp.]